ncbi:rCG40633 [Rattus norvegicus]|uniref:RCG40633 n=1 Tax=Rattus norvegicus TaxID=10116 RepID=A6I735_RAT|nr:rCG40633 [Rattus norvegicus]
MSKKVLPPGRREEFACGLKKKKRAHKLPER